MGCETSSAGMGWNGKILVRGWDGIWHVIKISGMAMELSGGAMVRAVMVSAGMFGHCSIFTYLMVWDRKYDGTRYTHHYPMLSFSAMARTIH